MIVALVKPTHLEDLAHSETLIAVVAGAFLATISGFAATQLEAVFARRRRERDAALLFGEVFSTLGIVLDSAAATRARGDPYGPVTMRMLRAARRELDIYDRNRGSLCELREARLRVAVGSTMVRLAIPLDGLLDAAAVDRATKDQSFDFMLSIAREIAPLVVRLGRVSGHSFDHFKPLAARARADIEPAAAAEPSPDPP